MVLVWRPAGRVVDYHSSGLRAATAPDRSGQLLDDGQDLVAVALELGRPDAVAGHELRRIRGPGQRDAAQVLVVDDDVRRHAVGAGPLRAPGPQRGLGLG